MRKIAHIVNPFHAPPDSDLTVAQPFTFETMRKAKKEAEHECQVELLSAQYPEDRDMVPEGFIATDDLLESVLDSKPFRKPRKLPLLREILQRMYDCSDAEYLVFTNVDIGVQPHFYLRINQEIENGFDAFIINRRRVRAKYTNTEQLPELLNDKGLPHPGFDCFVFHRDLFPSFELENVCIGVPFIGITLSQNLFCLANNFKLFDKEQLTFHIGLELFKKRAPKEYFFYNKREFWKAIEKLKPFLDTRKFPYADQFFLWRIFTWGLHPSIPIRLALKLEWQRFLGLFKGNSKG